MRRSDTTPARSTGDVRLALVVFGILFVMFGYNFIVEWIFDDQDPRPAEAREEPAAERPRHPVERQVQKRIDTYVRKHGEKPRRLRDVKGSLAVLDQNLPRWFDCEYDPRTARVRVFEIDPFVPGPSELSVFKAVGDSEMRASLFEGMLQGLVEGYEERHGRYPEDVRDVVEGQMGRGFRLPMDYKLEYDSATGQVDVVPK